MSDKIILASKSKVRKEILDKHNLPCEVNPSNVDEDVVKLSLIKEKATPEIISKNLAELKANKVSARKDDKLVLGADIVPPPSVLPMINLHIELCASRQLKTVNVTVILRL